MQTIASRSSAGRSRWPTSSVSESSRNASAGRLRSHRIGSVQQAIRPLYRNVLPRSPIAAATAPRYGNRGAVQAPNHPVDQARYHPQFGPQHHAVPVIHHEQVHGGQIHQEGRRLK